MADAPDCLTTLLGLSKGDNTCFPLPADADKAAAITASATGLYLDKVEGLRLAPATGQPAAADLYQRLSDARDLAAMQVRVALEAGRSNTAGIPLYQQRGTLGGLGNGQLAPAGTRALMSFYTNARREGAWRITKLQLYTDQGILNAPLLLDAKQVALLSTDGRGNTSGLPADGLVIPLDGNQHTLEVELPIGVRVKANNFFAGCFSCQKGSPWFQSVQLNLANVTPTTPGNGFAISVVEECTTDPDFLCYAIGTDTGRTVPRFPEITRYIGIAVLYKAAQLFTDGLLVNQQVSRYTLLEPKALAALSSKYQTQAAEYIGWLNSPEGLGQVQHPCFTGPPYRGPALIWTG